MPPRRTRENGGVITAIKVVRAGLVETDDSREASAGWLAAWSGCFLPRLSRWNRPNWRQLRLHRIFHQGTPKPSGVHGGPQWNPLRPTRNRSLNILSWHLHVCQEMLEGFWSRMALSRPVCLCWGVSYCTPHSHASCDQKPLNHFMYPRVALLAHGTAARQVTDQGESMFVYRSASRSMCTFSAMASHAHAGQLWRWRDGA